jgi:hypothetical protein
MGIERSGAGGKVVEAWVTADGRPAAGVGEGEPSANPDWLKPRKRTRKRIRNFGWLTIWIPPFIY